MYIHACVYIQYMYVQAPDLSMMSDAPVVHCLQSLLRLVNDDIWALHKHTIGYYTCMYTLYYIPMHDMASCCGVKVLLHVQSNLDSSASVNIHVHVALVVAWAQVPHRMWHEECPCNNYSLYC